MVNSFGFWFIALFGGLFSPLYSDIISQHVESIHRDIVLIYAISYFSDNLTPQEKLAIESYLINIQENVDCLVDDITRESRESYQHLAPSLP